MQLSPSISLPWLSFTVHLPSLELYLRSSYSSFTGISAKPEGLDLVFSSEPSQAEAGAITAYYQGLTQSGEQTKIQQYQITENVMALILKARSFADGIVNLYAAENVLMGITQADKTKQVSDYLADVMRYAQSGSLYEVVNEIDRLIQAGIPVDMSPFVTEQRLEQFKQKIITYLQG